MVAVLGPWHTSSNHYCHGLHMPATGHACYAAAGETSIQVANEKRFQDRVQQLFNQFKEQRLTSAALQCEQLINRASEQLAQVAIQQVWGAIAYVQC